MAERGFIALQALPARMGLRNREAAALFDRSVLSSRFDALQTSVVIL